MRSRVSTILRALILLSNDPNGRVVRVTLALDVLIEFFEFRSFRIPHLLLVGLRARLSDVG